MKKAGQKSSVLIIVLLFLTGISGLSALSTSEGPEKGATLFEIQRSRDEARVVYYLGRKATRGGRNEYYVEAFWVRNSDYKMKEPLTSIQRKYGYGIIVRPNSGDDDSILTFSIAATGDQLFRLRNSGEGKYNVYTNLQGEVLCITTVFVMFGNDSFLSPEISWIDIKGTDLNGKSRVIRLEKI